MLTSAQDIFLIAASICAVVLTLVSAAMIGVLIALILSLRRLISRISDELGELARIRSQAAYGASFARRWVALFARAMARRIIG